MKNEIDKDFYCSAVMNCMEILHCATSQIHGCIDCPARCRKWPTPEQFREEYGEEYPDDGAVWILIDPYEFPLSGGKWLLRTYAMEREAGNQFIVCACTPFGKPDKDWRPES